MTDDDAQIILYGTAWCPSTWFARRLFDERGVLYRWVDIDQDHEASAYVERVNGGYRSVPTIVFPDGSILVEPSSAQLDEKLKEIT